MNNNEKKPEDLFERLKGGSVFSFLKAADGAAGAVPSAKPEPLMRPEPSKHAQEVLDLKKMLMEMEARVKQLEKAAAEPSVPSIRGEVTELFSGLEKRLAALEGGLEAVSQKFLPALDQENELKRISDSIEGGLKPLMEEYRCSAEEKLTRMAEVLKKLGLAIESDRQTNTEGTGGLDRRMRALEDELSGLAGHFSGVLERTLKEGASALKNLLSEERARQEAAEARISERLLKLEQEVVRGGQQSASAFAELTRNCEINTSGIGEMRIAMEAARERADSLEHMLKESECALRNLLTEERTGREATEGEVAMRLKELEQNISSARNEAAAALAGVARQEELNTCGMEEVRLALDAARKQMDSLERRLKETENTFKDLFVEERAQREELKTEVLIATDNALNEERERIEALAGKIQGDIMIAARDKFSALRSLWEGAAVEIRNAQKTAYRAIEKCEKLEKSLYFLDHKTGALERKYSRYVADPPKPGGHAD